MCRGVVSIKEEDSKSQNTLVFVFSLVEALHLVGEVDLCEGDDALAASDDDLVGEARAAADLAARADPLDLPSRPDEVDSVVVVLRQAGADGENVGVEDDVLGVEANVLHQNAVGALADAHLQNRNKATMYEDI